MGFLGSAPNVIPMVMISTIAVLVVYMLVPAPRGVDRGHLAVLAGRSRGGGLTARLRRLPMRAREQLVALGAPEEEPDVGLLKLIGAGLGALVGLVAGLVFMPGFNLTMPGGIFAVAGYFCPEVIHRRRLAARQEQIEGEMVFFLANLRSFSWGANLYEALRLAVSGEEGALASAVEWVLGQATAGENLYEALGVAARRLAVDEFTMLVDTLQDAHGVGTPLEDAVKVVEVDMYRRWEADAQRQVGGMDFRLTVVGVLLLMPALFLVAMLPALVQVMREFM